MIAHTPGPWECTNEGSAHLPGYVVCKGNIEIACAWTKSDARLIAAAPDLLESCKRALITFPCGWEYDEARDIIRSAIAKAEGNT